MKSPRRDPWFSMALAALVVSYLVHVSLLGLSFPVPWPDESSFLWPSIAVQQMNTLVAPQINPDRPVMWMPPGYMIVQGLIFKLTGFSLEWARALSALYVSTAIVMCGAMLEPSTTRMLQLAFVGVFLHSPILLLAGNTARMEPLVLMLAASSLLLIWRGGIWPGLALAAVAPLVHPNAAYFTLGAAGYAAIRVAGLPNSERGWTRGLVWLCAPAVLWALYAVFVFQNWSHFRSDMGFQLSQKQSLLLYAGGILGLARDVRNVIAALLIAVLAVHAVRRRSVLAPLLAFVIPAHVLTVTTLGFMYEIYTAFEYWLICALVVHAVWSGSPASHGRFVLAARTIASGASTLALAMLAYYMLHSPAGLTKSVTFATAPLGDDPRPAYFASADARAVRTYLDSLRGSGQVPIVEFQPVADALLFSDAEGSSLRFSHFAFHRATPNVYIVHESRHLSARYRAIIDNILTVEARIPLPLTQWPVIHGRDTTERWRVYRRDP